MQDWSALPLSRESPNFRSIRNDGLPSTALPVPVPLPRRQAAAAHPRPAANHRFDSAKSVWHFCMPEYLLPLNHAKSLPENPGITDVLWFLHSPNPAFLLQLSTPCDRNQNMYSRWAGLPQSELLLPLRIFHLKSAPDALPVHIRPVPVFLLYSLTPQGFQYMRQRSPGQESSPHIPEPQARSPPHTRWWYGAGPHFLFPPYAFPVPHAYQGRDKPSEKPAKFRHRKQSLSIHMKHKFSPVRAHFQSQCSRW